MLDFGCGHGRATLALLDRGYDVRGTDIDGSAVSAGQEELARHGQDHTRLQLTTEGHVPFPDASFDFVFSQEVFEHVARVEDVVREIRRMTAEGGCGFHVYPAQFRPVEPHLRMPFVHWLPKNRVRRAAISFWSHVGVEPPPPPEIPGAGRDERIAFEFRYSLEQTFYRRYADVAEEFARAGFEVESVATHHRRLEHLSFLRREPLRAPAEALLRSFTSVKLLTKLPPAS